MEKIEKPTETGAGVALPNTQGYLPIQQGANINYGNVLMHDMEDTEAIAEAMASAVVSPLDATKQIWSPSELGDAKLLMMLGYEYLDVEHDGKRSRIPYVIFAESYMPKGGKKPMIRLILIGRTKVVHFFLDIDRDTKEVRGAKQPLQSLWQITYGGIKVAKNKNIHDYSIAPAIVR